MNEPIRYDPSGDPRAALPEFSEAEIARKLAAGDRPYVTLKAGATLDGKVATRTGESQWITGEPARALAHALRALHDGVLVGVNTVLHDDPQLTVRLSGGAEARPARIVLDSTCRTPPGARLLAADGAARYVVAGSAAPPERVAALRRAGAEVWQAPTPRPEPGAFLPWLRARGLGAILVEGGAAVHGGLIANREADAVFLFLAGRLIGDAEAPGWCGALGVSRLSETPRLRLSPPRPVGEDLLVHGLFLRPEAAAP